MAWQIFWFQDELCFQLMETEWLVQLSVNAQTYSVHPERVEGCW